ncbi:MAG: hypothetical protein AB1Z65_07815 [Candidatus Sulfomarinibacteraceae bacterium]
MKTRPNPVSPVHLVVLLAVIVAAGAGAEDEPWIITTPVVITEPVELGHVIVLDGGSLTVRDLPEPGLEMRGHIWATGSSSVRLENSVIQFLSVYHGQYSLVGADTARIDVTGCDYRVPRGVQHALFTVGRAEMTLEDTDFADVQLISTQASVIDARRLTGNFEVIVQDDSTMRLAEIPSVPEAGSIWVWVEFGEGTVADYTPPMPGYVESWSFPPPESSGIEQTITVDRCRTLLWPMLVRPGSDVTLRDIPAEHWVVVGFHLPNDVTIGGLHNDQSYGDVTLDLPDRSFRLVDASVDTWNLYPQADARVAVRDSLVGEILSMGDSRVVMERVTVDGTGGFFGARDASRITATACTFTCTIEATQEAAIVLRQSSAEPYPLDPTGAWTRFGAYDDGRLLADQTGVFTTPALDGRGLIAVAYLEDPPEFPPGGAGVALFGSVGQYSLDPGVAAGSWRLESSDRGGAAVVIGEGSGNVENGFLGEWSGADPAVDHRLQTVLTDGLGRTLVGNLVVPGAGSRVR